MGKAEKTSRYVGVSRNKNNCLFLSQISVNKVPNIKIGCFTNEIDAAIAYDDFVRENKLKRRLNFPDPEPENLIPNTRLIRLTQGKFAVVDEEDFERVNQYTWCAHRIKGKYYATRRVIIDGKASIRAMHCFIMNCKLSDIDHVNNNGLHNYKSNLRDCTHAQNMRNRIKSINLTSKYKGVSLGNNGNKFRSQIHVNKKGIFLGYFISEIEAAKAYDAAAIKYFGEFANINFKN